jgi:hypothetical protein
MLERSPALIARQSLAALAAEMSDRMALVRDGASRRRQRLRSLPFPAHAAGESSAVNRDEVLCQKVRER